jgi:tol-pal system protein YbgF
VLTATLALAGCAPSADMNQLQSNESSLREMVANDRSQIEALQEQLARQNDKIAELEHGGGDSDVAALQARLSKLEGAAKPSGAAETAPEPAASPSPGAEATGGENPAEASAEEGNAEPSPAATPAPPVAQTALPPTWQAAAAAELAGAQNDAGAKLYRAGLADMQAGKYQLALSKFQDLQRRYPKSALSEPAEYFSGNALYELGQHEKSILQFNDLTMRFPEGRYASAALLREAQAFMKISDQIDARLTLNKLLNDHPDAPEAVTARSLMQSLSS